MVHTSEANATRVHYPLLSPRLAAALVSLSITAIMLSFATPFIPCY